ncbi:MAG: O-antigen ligase family protein [Pseudomonadota bacterium]
MSAAAPPDRRRAVAGAALAFLVLLLLPVGRSAELPLLIAAAWAVALLWRHARGADLALVLGLCAAYTLPAILSTFDAVDAGKSWTTAIGSLRFALFGAAMVLLLAGQPRTRAVLWDLVAALVALWTLDALVQGATGWSLGGAMTADRVSGVFGADNLKLGPVLAVLSPFALLSARERLGRAGLGVAWLVLASVILVAGARAGWVMFVLVTVVLLRRELPRGRDFALALLGAGILAGAVGAIARQASPPFAERVARTAAVFEGGRAGLDHALAGRLPIFETAWAMGAAHPFNGVGVRGYRHAYAAHAAADDPWLRPENGGAALHPHQVLLELWAETGALGVLAWLAGAALAIRAWRRADVAAREAALAPGLALAVMVFPLNTHFAFYSSFWGLLFGWLLALYAAALARPSREGA